MGMEIHKVAKVDVDTKGLLSVFVYGTLKRGHRNHDRYCREAASIEGATVRGQLYELPSGIPVLRVPNHDIFATGTSDPLADVLTQHKFFGQLTGRAPDDEASWQMIHGELVAFPNPALSLPPIDRLEAYRPGMPNLYRRVLVADASGLEQSVLWWQGGIWTRPQGTFDLAYTVRATDFRGERQVQVEWLEARAREALLIEVITDRPGVEIVDYRGDRAPAQRLQELKAEGDLLVWAEGFPRGEQPGVDRHNLSPTSRLAIWTLPAGPEELREVIGKTSPSTVYFFGIETGLDQPSAFLKRLSGMVKYALRELGGQLQLSSVAAALGHRAVTVRKGFEWLIAKGQVCLVAESEEAIILNRDSGGIRSDLGVVQAQLAALLEETAAYRDYYRSAAKEHLL